MKIFKLNELPLTPLGGVVALGFFDGVHKAHREILKTARRKAEALGVPFGVFTFASESDIKKEAKRLYTTDERLEIIEGLGADFAVLADFAEIRSLSEEEFVKGLLIGKLNCDVAVAGYNFRFGKGALGDSEALFCLMEKSGRRAVIVEEVTVSGSPVSSTLIRSFIEEGRIEESNIMLGSPYAFFGKVVHGNNDGKKLGIPTVNTEIHNKVTPKLGAYRSLVLFDGEIYNAVTNIGKCPTLGEREIHLETHMIGFSGDIYGKNVKIFLLGFLREERLFASEKELIMQINIDKNITLEENGVEKWQELGLR